MGPATAAMGKGTTTKCTSPPTIALKHHFMLILNRTFEEKVLSFWILRLQGKYQRESNIPVSYGSAK